MTEQHRLDEQVIADLRRTHTQLAASVNGHTTPSGVPWSMRLTLEEVDALLRLHDEVTELRRQTVGDWEPDFPPVSVREVRARMREFEDENGTTIRDPLHEATGIGPMLDALNDAVHTLAKAQVLPRSNGLSVDLDGEGCPRRNTIHDCPLGGCPTGREARETPPDLPARPVFLGRHHWQCDSQRGRRCPLPRCECPCHRPEYNTPVAPA